MQKTLENKTELRVSNINFKKVAHLFKLLGDPTRLKIALACVDGPISVGNIANLVGRESSAVSGHLSHLKNAGILHDERKGKERHYSYSNQRFGKYLSDMSQKYSNM